MSSFKPKAMRKGTAILFPNVKALGVCLSGAYLLRHCPKVESLALVFNYRTEDYRLDTIEDILQKQFEEAAKAPAIRSLELKIDYIYCTTSTLTGKLRSRVCLLETVFHSNESDTDLFVIGIAKHLPQLSELSLRCELARSTQV
jgi:hypothetical protein